ncbi:barH-like 1 homeobox protein [Rattus rattus]|uniref:barH-like 1 homeobox protein n=1 Tax=Rattus rattus TaxID=10117 RepID=UPI0013F2EAC8|nr:barH-like 1 homeobox protein [Rattus rattus]
MGSEVTVGPEFFRRNILQEVQSPHMPKGPFLHSKFHMCSNAPRESSFQMPQGPARDFPCQVFHSLPVTRGSPMQSCLSVPERDLCPQESQRPSKKSSIQMQPGHVMDQESPTLRSLLVHPSRWKPRFSVKSGLQSTLGSVVQSGEHGDQQTSRVASRKERKVRITYTEKQKRVLQDHFNNCRYPTQKDRMALASLVGVTHNDIQVWFKNNRAKDKRKNRQNIPAALPETSGGSEAVSESTHFPDSLPVVDSANVESTFVLDSIPKVNQSQEFSLYPVQACGGARCSQQEDLLYGHAPDRGKDSAQSAAGEVQTGLAVAEAPLAMVCATQGPQSTQDSGPSAEELWQRILEDFDKSEDWYFWGCPPSP